MPARATQSVAKKPSIQRKIRPSERARVGPSRRRLEPLRSASSMSDFVATWSRHRQRSRRSSCAASSPTVGFNASYKLDVCGHATPLSIEGKADGKEPQPSRRHRRTSTRSRSMKIGFVGLGTMGAPMARNLLDAGLRRHGAQPHTRTRGSRSRLRERVARSDAGARPHATRTSSSRSSRTHRTSRTSCSVPTASRNARSPAAIVVDMSTISAEATQRFGERLARTRHPPRRRAGVRRLRGGREGDAHDHVRR